MCGRYTLYSDQDTIEEAFDVHHAADDDGIFNKNYNVAPGTPNPVVLQPKPEKKGIGALKWGLIPGWADDENIGYKMINARSETLMEKTSFKKPFQRQRCIIPANGFYEWQTIFKKKIPFYISHIENDLIGFAGLYERWVDPSDETNQIWSYTIITTKANELLEPLHERMPVILNQQNYAEWLNPVNSDTEALNELLVPCPSEQLRVYRVSDEVNNTKNNGAELLQPTDA